MRGARRDVTCVSRSSPSPTATTVSCAESLSCCRRRAQKHRPDAAAFSTSLASISGWQEGFGDFHGLPDIGGGRDAAVALLQRSVTPGGEDAGQARAGCRMDVVLVITKHHRAV